MYLRIFLVAFLSFFNFLGALYGQNPVGDPIKLRIDPQTAVPIRVSELYEKVEYIPLEATKESTIGRISKLEVVGDYIIVNDSDTYSILIFKLDGSFVKKITARLIASHAGMSASVPEGNVFNSFFIERKGDQDYVRVHANKQLVYFTTSGQFSQVSKTIDYAPFITFKDGTQLIKSYKLGDSIYNYVLKKGEDVKPFGVWKGNKLNFEELYRQGDGFYLSRDKQSVLFSDYYSYDVHEINEQGAKLKYQFIFPSSHTLPSDFLENNKYNGKRWDYFVEHRQVVIGMQNIVEVGDYLYFSNFSYAPGNAEKKNFALHMPSRKLISLQDIIPDELTNFLPTNDAAGGNIFMTKGFTTYDSNYFYTIISPLSMLKFASENVDFKGQYPERLAKSISLGANANPTIVKITPKLK